MASSSRDPNEAGYATAAAALIALALSIVVSAVIASSLSELRASREAFERRKIEYALAGMHQSAVLAVLEGGQARRYRWLAPSSLGEVEILAEPEAAKLSLTAAKDLDDADLTRLGVLNPERFRSRLTALSASDGGSLALRSLDNSVLWRTCGESVVSRYGTGLQPTLTAAQVPESGRFDWRAPEVWRVRVSSRRGWVEDRIVRFTGSAGHPAAVVERALYRGRGEGEPCSALIE